MPPPRSKPQPDDSRSETSSIKEKAGTNASNLPNGKARRVGGTAAIGSSLRDVVTAGPSGALVETAPTIDWPSFDATVLNNYRYGYRLNTPATFCKPYNHLVLSQSKIGRKSPTMAKRKEQRRQTHEQLANVARKHFNNMGITENEIVVDFLYKVRWQDKNFRMRFDPQRPRQ